MTTLLGQKIETGKCYVFLKNIRTGSSTQRKVKMIGICTKPDGRMKFVCRWAEGYSWPVGEQYNIRDPKDVICEYTPVEGYQLFEDDNHEK